MKYQTLLGITGNQAARLIREVESAGPSAVIDKVLNIALDECKAAKPPVTKEYPYAVSDRLFRKTTGAGSTLVLSWDIERNYLFLTQELLLESGEKNGAQLSTT